MSEEQQPIERTRYYMEAFIASLRDTRHTPENVRTVLCEFASMRTEQSNAALFGTAMDVLRQIATTPRNRKARVNANAAVRFIETQMEQLLTPPSQTVQPEPSSQSPGEPRPPTPQQWAQIKRWMQERE